MQDLIRQLLAELGEDPGREGLQNTPKRVEKALKFLTSGYDANLDDIVKARFSRLQRMVIVKDMSFYSMCNTTASVFSASAVAYPIEQGDRPPANSPDRGRVQRRLRCRAPDEPDRRHHPASSGLWRGGVVGHAPVHVDARGGSRTRSRRARCWVCSRSGADTDGIHGRSAAGGASAIQGQPRPASLHGRGLSGMRLHGLVPVAVRSYPARPLSPDAKPAREAVTPAPTVVPKTELADLAYDAAHGIGRGCLLRHHERPRSVEARSSAAAPSGAGHADVQPPQRRHTYR